MTFHCTLVRSPASGRQGPPLELTIEAPAGTTGAQLEAGLRERFGTGPVTIDGQNIIGMSLGEPPLVGGAILVDGPAKAAGLKPAKASTKSPASLALAVHSGPGAGTVVPLQRGTYSIGRGSTDILIPDEQLSRDHARLDVTETVITIVDLDSANGTEVDGERIRSTTISTRSVIRCGNTTMSLIFLAAADPGLAEAGASVEEPLVVSQRMEPTNRVGLLLTAVLPLVIGVGLAVVTGMWIFLAFTAVSAVSILVPVCSGRRQRRALAAAIAAAVQEDKERRRRSAPPLSALVIATHFSQQRITPAAVPAEPIWLRLGLAVQSANIRFEPLTSDTPVPSAGLMPLTLDPARAVTTVRGSRTAVEGLVRSALMQLAGHSRARTTHVVVHGATACLPLSGRHLPAVTLSSNSAALMRLLARGHGQANNSHGVLILTGPAVSAESHAAIVAKAVEFNWQVIRFCFGEGSPATADGELSELESSGGMTAESIPFMPDLAPEPVFSRFCRQQPRQHASSAGGGREVPASCSLVELLPDSPEATSARWEAGRLAHSLAVPIGGSLEGKRLLDLEADGPHILVAGTTGSGKSELLRTLTLALAMSYPPDRVNFLFVDFKGGSGLGPLTGLPHCVGMLTDLTRQELERSLESLLAEIRLREELLASVQAPDLMSYRITQAGQVPPLPHLILVIDEFRMLVDDAPDALQELMRIAAIGRSLGIHLIMATQRPQGALTADIRANVTTSIALRVQSEMESMDIINSKAAAGISVDTPGRAFLVRGLEAPEEFQAASIGTAPLRDIQGITVRLATAAIESSSCSGVPASDPAAATPSQAAAPLVAVMADLWDPRGGHGLRRPVAPPLPLVLPEPAMPAPASTDGGAPPWLQAGAGCARSIQLGLMDLPSEQRIAPVIWEPGNHGHLALIGGPESGVAEALNFAVHRLATHSAESHLYILDADSSLRGLAAHNRTGALACMDELPRAVRILQRLAREQSQRLSGARSGNKTDLVLVVSGWGSWVSALRSGPLAWAEDLVHDLVRDGGSTGITVILSGERELVTARFFASVPNRVYFPAGSSEDSRLAWPKLPATEMARGRAVAVGALSGGKSAVCQFYAPSCGAGDGHPEPVPIEHSIVARPFRVEPLPMAISVHEIRREQTRDTAAGATLAEDRWLRPQRERYQRLLIGVGGDELEPAYVMVPAGTVLAVLGGPSSGKTNFIRSLALLNEGAGPWLVPKEGMDPHDYWSSIRRKAAAGGLERGSMALVDDADLLPAATNQELVDLNAMGFTVVLTASFSPMLLQRVPLMLGARGSGNSLLIAPRTLLDGDLFGVRFDVEPHPPPGRAALLSGGRSMAVQLALVPPGIANPEMADPEIADPEIADPEILAEDQRAGGDPPVREA